MVKAINGYLVNQDKISYIFKKKFKKKKIYEQFRKKLYIYK